MPPPPYSSGTDMPKKPSSPILLISASGTRSSWRWMCSAIGATSVSANWRTESRVIAAISSPSQLWLTPRCSHDVAADRAEHARRPWRRGSALRSSRAPSVALRRSSPMPNSAGCASICAAQLERHLGGERRGHGGEARVGLLHRQRRPRRPADRAPRAPRSPRTPAARSAPARRRCPCRRRCACSPPRAPRAPARRWSPTSFSTPARSTASLSDVRPCCAPS